MIELAVTLVLISGMVIAFQAVPRGEGAAADRTAQGRIDAVANAVYNAYRPGVRTQDLTAEMVSQYTNTPIVTDMIDPVGRRDVSLAFGDGSSAERPAGYFGIAALGREGACWYMRGRVGLTGEAGASLQTAWYSYSDFLPDGPTSADAQAVIWCTGEIALLQASGGSSWQQFTITSVLDPD